MISLGALLATKYVALTALPLGGQARFFASLGLALGVFLVVDTVLRRALPAGGA